MISDVYEGIVEKKIRRTGYIDEVLARMEKGSFSLIAHEHMGHRFLQDVSKEDSSTSEQSEEIIGERVKRLKEVRDYQPSGIDQSHMQDVLDREPQFPGGF
jgi:hypothetical protein